MKCDGTEELLEKVRNKLTKAKEKKKLITLRMVGYYDENAALKENFSLNVRSHCCSKTSHTIVFAISIAFTGLAILIKYYN